MRDGLFSDVSWVVWGVVKTIRGCALSIYNGCDFIAVRTDNCVVFFGCKSRALSISKWGYMGRNIVRFGLIRAIISGGPWDIDSL